MSRLYYSIKEVSEKIGVKQYVIRYWETQFPFLTRTRKPNGNRRYNQEDVRRLQQIYQLLRVEKYTIKGAQKEIKKIKQEEKKKALASKDKSINHSSTKIIPTKIIDHEKRDKQSDKQILVEKAKRIKELVKEIKQEIQKLKI